MKKKNQNEKRKNKARNRRQKEPEDLGDPEPDEFSDLHDQLKSGQKPGVIFPKDTCSTKGLTSDLEVITFTQYTLKCGLKEFGKDGVEALGKEMEQLHTQKVGKPIHSSNLTREQKKHPSDTEYFSPRNDAEESRHENVQTDESNDQLPASRRHQSPPL